MMKKLKTCCRRLFCLLAATLTLITFNACGEKTADSYMDGSDYQYMYDGYPMAETPDSYFYLAGSFLYKIDKTTMEGEPFCSRPGCLHQLESPQTVLSCEAFVYSHLLSPFLAYQDGWLYLARSVNDPDTGALATEIQRTQPGGAEWEAVYTLKSSCSAFILHRGYLYYAMSAYDREGIKGHGVYRQPLDQAAEPELVCIGLMKNGKIDRMAAYGDSLYLYETGMVEGHLQSQTAVCSLKSKKIRQLEEQDKDTDPMSARKSPTTCSRYTVQYLCRAEGKDREWDFIVCRTENATQTQREYIERLGEGGTTLFIYRDGEAKRLIPGGDGRLFYTDWGPKDGEKTIFTLYFLTRNPEDDVLDLQTALRIDDSDGEHYYHSVVTGED